MLAMLWASASAWVPFRAQTQYDMLEYMRDEDHNVYVIFFYNSNQDSKENSERMRQIVLQERGQIKQNVLEAFDNIIYGEIDLASGEFDELAHDIGIETQDVLEYPTVVAVQDGVGKWVHGPDLVQLIVPVVRALISRQTE